MSADRIHEALQYVPADDRDLWVKMAMAVKSELGEDGFALWDAWSQEADSYKARDAYAVWKSVRADGSVTILSLYREARDRGWRPSPDGNQPIPPPKKAARAAQGCSEPRDWSERAEAIWRRTQPLRGTPGEVYLRYRGCALPPPDSDVRFLPATDRHPPSLCARVSDILTGRPISLHLTRLAPDGRGKAGTDRDKVLLGGHRKAGGVIRVWPDELVTLGLALGEGIESVCAFAHVHTPVWAAIDAGNLTAFPVLPGIETITIYADHDDAGMKAARECALRWHRAGRQVRVLRSRRRGRDAADIAGGAAA